MLRGFFSICNSVITDDFGNYDAIILENFSTTLLLGFTMLVMLTPPLQGFLVPPEGNWEKFIFVREAWETFYRNESIYLFKLSSQLCCQVKIRPGSKFCFGLYLKNDCVHRILLIHTNLITLKCYSDWCSGTIQYALKVF